MSEATILIVDDEDAIRDMIAVTLELAGFDSIIAENTKQAHISIVDNKPDLVLLDWMLPGGSGIELIRRLRRDEATKDLPVIMLSAKSSENNKVQGLSEGVDDYITKPFSSKELIARIKSVLRRAKGSGEDKPIEVFDLMLDPSSHRVSIGEKPLEMGPTEYRLLHFFMSNPGKVFSRDYIQSAVWGSNTYLDERTIDVHIRRLRKALSSVDESESADNAGINYASLVQTVRGTGYRFSARNCED
jgi:two-component system, OmpR family, phosphate regulon response regulator PhoB